MKIKNIVLFSLLSPIIVSCNNPLSNIFSSGSGVIRSFIDNKDLNVQYDIFFSEIYNPQDVSLSLVGDNIYSSSSSTIYRYNLKNSKIEKEIRTCVINSSVGVNLFGVFDKSNENCDYSRDKIKKGQNETTYLVNNYRVAKMVGNNISDVYLKKVSETDLFSDMAIDKSSNLYLTFINNNTIKKVNSSGNAEWSRTSGNTTGEEFYNPLYIEVDKNENIYFFDSYDKKIKKMTSDGVVSTIIGGGNKTELNIQGKEYKILDPQIKLSFDNVGNLYIVELSKNRILKYDIQSSMLLNFSGSSFKGFRDDNSLSSPLAITFDLDNNAYILDSGNKVIKKRDIKTGLTSTIIGNSPSHGDGNDISKVFVKDVYSIYSKNNNLYITEIDRIRKIDSNLNTTTIAGNGQLPKVRPSASPIIIDEQDKNLPANESLVFTPQILHIDKNNNIYISERDYIRKITNENKIESISQSLSSSNSITEDSKGNLYFSSSNIKRVDKSNNIEQFAGQPSQYENFLSSLSGPPGPPPDPSSPYAKRDNLQNGTKAKDIYNLNPRSIISDSNDNIYAIAQYSYNMYDGQNSKYCIIKISPDGVLDIVAGNTKNKTYSEKDLINSTDLSIPINPKKIIIDKKDNLYFTDTITNNNLSGNQTYRYDVIRKIDNMGKMSLYAGKSSHSNTSQQINNVNAKDAVFIPAIKDLTVDDNGFIYFVNDDNKIYKIE